MAVARIISSTVGDNKKKGIVHYTNYFTHYLMKGEIWKRKSSLI
jgi:hypothetical protein